MAHITLTDGLPGIRGLFDFSPQTAEPMSRLAQILLHDPSSLSRAERELIATYVSSQNDCNYCQTAHGAIAAYHLNKEGSEVDGDAPRGEMTVLAVKRDFQAAPVSEKLKALLAIAGKVQQGGKRVLSDDVQNARLHGATDREIHDTVLIAAAFCMYNRYVDGLATWTPTDPEGYKSRAAGVAENGYMRILSDVQRTKADVQKTKEGVLAGTASTK
jgi:uncharacterized peroxidase-related enzyme